MYFDIDVDFEHQRREEVIQYIYRKYGRERAALAAVVISYRPKSALRDSGRALGIDLDIVEKVAKAHHWFDGKRDLLNRLAECGLDPLALLRPQLLERCFMPATTLAAYKNGQLARACGIVTMRQRPGTAKGVIFMTLEDESGSVNVNVWLALIDQQPRLLLRWPYGYLDLSIRASRRHVT
ncbi:error-prone DNA polymerase domain protein [Janthinobacterium agaricidamnosum NBRC 102515 = DSM 9628]|uniref:Error-prone DNA polymerase domain protein n=1 Tax=Janthinobacterium agaricidamnosum NBRC 102515 = DSM 9628 TaxID=1349767 RepID=W0UZJ7_9BURK|nr:error-prone DNA polymerase domain protein [Janthinobacterium agaricidamnosum NBRC 102515 = DSM 9628]